MPCVPVKFGRRKAFITFGGNWKPGDQAPEGYLDWHEWAEVQHKSGLRQVECSECCKWKFPQEIHHHHEVVMQDSKGRPVTVKCYVCNRCAALAAHRKGRRK